MNKNIYGLADACSRALSALIVAGFALTTPDIAAATAAAGPVFSPAPGTFTSAQKISMTDTTAGAAIHYTTNGATPTASSPKYTNPIPISATTTIKAIAVATGFGNSAITTGAYTVKITANPKLSPTPGTFTSVQTISMTDATPGAAIHYTTNGAAPTASSSKYTSPIPISAPTTIKAIAVTTGFGNSAVITGTYTVKITAKPVFNPAPGTFTSARTISMTDATPGAAIHYTTNGATPNASSPKYTTPIPISATTTIKAIAVTTGFGNSAVITGTYTVKITANPVLSPAAGTYTSNQTISMTDATPGAAIHYTTNGATPTASSPKYTSPFSIGATTTIKAIAVTTGFGNSAVITGIYTIKVVATPLLSPAPGTFTSAQTISMTDASPGASIHYTTNGTTPTASSPKYTTPISIGTTTTTIKAIAVATGSGNSAVAGGTYTIKIAVGPVLSPAPGTYTSVQSVSMTDATSGAVIHYTTNGTAPTNSSPTYINPITVGTTTTIKAIAVATGFGSSAVTGGTYTIKIAATPVFSPAPGTYSSAQAVSMTDTTSGAIIHYTTNGTTPTVSSPTYVAPVTISATTTFEAIAVATGLGNSVVARATYTINLPAAPTPIISPASGIYGPPVLVTLNSCHFDLCLVSLRNPPVIYYTTDGSAPSASSNRYSSPFAVDAGAITKINAITIQGGFSNSAVTTATYTVPNFPSDALPGEGIYLTNNYTPDNCRYYQAVGAIVNVPSGADPCQTNGDAPGSYTYGLTQAVWLSTVFNPLKVNARTASVEFVNIMDLNFTRDHHMVTKFSGTQSAAYVCNYPGADFYHDGLVHAQGVVDQAAVDSAIQNIQDQVGLVACVAIDYGIVSDPQGHSGMRFMVFDGKTGNLLPRVDLDGRGKKEIPNVCSACHGIPFEAQAPAQAVQVPNGGRYIPFDEGSLVFSSTFTPANRSSFIKFLNLMVLQVTADQVQQANPGAPPGSDPISQLIHSWYDSKPCPSPGDLASLQQAVLALPCGLSTASFTEQDAYWALYAPYCRSCHVGNGVQAYQPPTAPGVLASLFKTAKVCNPLTGNPTHTMANSKVSFDRFWTSHLGPTATPFSDTDLPYFMAQFLSCSLDTFPSAIR